MIDLSTFASNLWRDTMLLDWPGKIGFAVTLATIFVAGARLLSRASVSRLRRQMRETGEKLEATLVSQANEIETLREQLALAEGARMQEWFFEIDRKTAGKPPEEVIDVLLPALDNAAPPLGLMFARLADAQAQRIDSAAGDHVENLQLLERRYRFAAELTGNPAHAQRADWAKKQALVAKAMR